MTLAVVVDVLIHASLLFKPCYAFVSTWIFHLLSLSTLSLYIYYNYKVKKPHLNELFIIYPVSSLSLTFGSNIPYIGTVRCLHSSDGCQYLMLSEYMSVN